MPLYVGGSPRARRARCRRVYRARSLPFGKLHQVGDAHPVVVQIGRQFGRVPQLGEAMPEPVTLSHLFRVDALEGRVYSGAVVDLSQGYCHFIVADARNEITLARRRANSR